MSATADPMELGESTSTLAGSTTTTTTTTTAATTVVNAIAKTVAIISSTVSAGSTTGASPSSTSSGTTPTPSPTPTPTPTSSHSFSSNLEDAEEKLSVKDLSQALQHFGIVDYLVFIAMLAVCAVIGFYFGFIEKNQKKKKLAGKDRAGAAGLEERRGSEALDYLVGGRQMKVFPVALSLVASFVSGISLLGTSTEIYVYGTQYAFILVTLAISGTISWYIFLPVFCNLQLTSTYEYFERRFSRRMRLFGASLFVLKAIIWLPIAVYVPALTFNQVSGIGIHTITPIVIIICTFYTCVGGIKGVVYTDVVQSVIMYGSLIVIMIKGTVDLGGFGVVWQRNMEGGRLNTPEWTMDPTVRLSVFSVFVGGTFFKLQSTSINQATVQRFMSLPTLKAIKQTLFTFSIGLVLLYCGCVYVGLVCYATYYDCDPMSTGLAGRRDQLVPLLVMRVLGVVPGLPGLFVSAVFSAALSSLSTLLNSLAAVILEDFVRPRMGKAMKENHIALTMRLVVVTFGISSIFMVYVVEKLGMVLQLSATLQSSLYGPMLGIFTVGMLMPWVGEKCVFLGSIASFMTMAWIAVNAQIANITGSFRHTKLPVSVEQCDYEFDMSRYLNSTAEYEPHSGSSVYHMSFLLYAMLGASLTIILSNLATLVFGRQDIRNVDENLLAPFVQRYLRKNQYYETVELKKPEAPKLSESSD
ncbi:sodium-coupled monocarboxylate transporter 1 isoform X5 [Drosophila kikkawai]|uniref:Sodium-coupled monocarboxylate transporter 1 isoform X5 n=1 Tax=Drosophila kikkawai TaxID=30033 RepID=A0ABM4GJ54_DROKI|nr:sodium-coupled monocarboxylate transporter 1 isoform X6 [Drosophila kikkawai]